LTAARKSRRDEQRKFKRIEVRYGTDKATHRGFAVQISSRGAFIAARHPIYEAGSRIIIAFALPDGICTATAVVRHCKSLPPQMARFGKPGMGVELVSAPEELLEYLRNL
jgi:hypothetical protein